MDQKIVRVRLDLPGQPTQSFVLRDGKLIADSKVIPLRKRADSAAR